MTSTIGSTCPVRRLGGATPPAASRHLPGPVLRRRFWLCAPHWRLEPRGSAVTFPAMSTLTEIEEAIETLPPSQVEQLAAWLKVRRAGGNAGADDLAALAGSWEEDPAFEAAVKAFEQVDETVWR